MKSNFTALDAELANDVISEFDTISTRINAIAKILWQAELLTIIAAQHKDSREQLFQNRREYERSMKTFYAGASAYIEECLSLINKKIR